MSNNSMNSTTDGVFDTAWNLETRGILGMVQVMCMAFGIILKVAMFRCMSDNEPS